MVLEGTFHKVENGWVLELSTREETPDDCWDKEKTYVFSSFSEMLLEIPNLLASN